jgi:hypothetical protein
VTPFSIQVSPRALPDTFLRHYKLTTAVLCLGPPSLSLDRQHSLQLQFSFEIERDLRAPSPYVFSSPQHNRRGAVMGRLTLSSKPLVRQRIHASTVPYHDNIQRPDLPVYLLVDQRSASYPRGPHIWPPTPSVWGSKGSKSPGDDDGIRDLVNIIKLAYMPTLHIKTLAEFANRVLQRSTQGMLARRKYVA